MQKIQYVATPTKIIMPSQTNTSNRKGGEYHRSHRINFSCIEAKPCTSNVILRLQSFYDFRVLNLKLVLRCLRLINILLLLYLTKVHNLVLYIIPVYVFHVSVSCVWCRDNTWNVMASQVLLFTDPSVHAISSVPVPNILLFCSHLCSNKLLDGLVLK